jgi:hypothetical protein
MKNTEAREVAEKNPRNSIKNAYTQIAVKTIAGSLIPLKYFFTVRPSRLQATVSLTPDAQMTHEKAMRTIKINFGNCAG